MFGWKFFLGVALALVSGVVNNLGTLLQKKAVNEYLKQRISELTLSGEIPHDGKYSSIKISMKQLMFSKTWLIGFISQSVLATALFIAAQILIGPTLTPAIGAFGIIVIVFASCLVQEVLSWYEYVGIILMVGAVFMLGYSDLVIETAKVDFLATPLMVRVAGYTAFIIALCAACKVWAKRKDSLEGTALALLSGSYIGLSNFWIAPLTSLAADIFGGKFHNPTFHHHHPAGIAFFMLACLFFVIASNVLAIYERQLAFRVGHAATMIPISHIPSHLSSPVIFSLVFWLPPPTHYSLGCIWGGIALLLISSFIFGQREAMFEQRERVSDKEKMGVPIVFIHGFKGCKLVQKSTQKTAYINLLQSVGLKPASIGLPMEWEGVSDEKGNFFKQKEDDILPASAFHRVGLKPMYGPFMKEMTRHNNRPFFTFSYDWRRDLNESCEKFVNFIKDVSDKYSDSPIQIIAHDMGGLVALGAIHDPQLMDLIHSVLFAGVPFNPSMAPFQDIMGGSRNGGMSKVLSPEVLFSFPSVYALLPKKDETKIVDHNGAPIPVDFYDPSEWPTHKLGIFRATEGTQDEREHLKRCVAQAASFREKLMPLTDMKYPPIAVLGSHSHPTVVHVKRTEEGDYDFNSLAREMGDSSLVDPTPYDGIPYELHESIKPSSELLNDLPVLREILRKLCELGKPPPPPSPSLKRKKDGEGVGGEEEREEGRDEEKGLVALPSGILPGAVAVARISSEHFSAKKLSASSDQLLPVPN